MPNEGAGGKAAGQSRVGGYQVIAKLGQGGMGAVFKAVQLSIDRTVALKILPPRLAKNQEYVTRFFREARSAAKLNHPNIVQAFDAGQADGYYYFAMEFVDGQPLGNLLKAGNPLPERQALEIVRDIARALNYAHEAGIVHRDIKPANILLTSTGVPKLADLGLAREASATGTDITQAGYAIGTPDYISPEQVRGDADIDGRSDVYSLGATLYHMLVGRPPFAGGTGNEVMAKHLAEPVPNVHKANPQVSHASARIIWKAMVKDRERRYKTAGEMAYDIERVLAGAAGAGVQPGAPGAAPQPTTPKADGGKKQLYIGGGVVAALLALVLAISVLSGPGDKPDPGPAPNGPTTPPKPANDSSDQDLLKYLRDWAKKRPGEYLGNIRKYEANIPKMKDRVVRLRATDDLSTLKREHKQAAEKSFAGIHKKADALIRTGRYADAAALFENLPREFVGLLADHANGVARELRKGAEGITRADEFSKAGKPDKGLAELANLTDIKHAAMQTKIRELSERLEAERKNIAERERQRALAAAKQAVAKLLEDIEAAVARGDLAEAGRAADAALQDEKLRPAEAALKPIAAVGQALGKMAVCEKASPIPKLKEQVGREVTLATKQSSIKGILKQVTDKIVVIEKKFKIGDEWKTKTHTVPIADLTDETLRQFRPEWTAKSRDDHIAVAMVALKEKDIARAEAALKAAEGHPLHSRYAPKLAELKRASAENAAELAAAKAWGPAKPYAAKPNLTPSERETCKKLLAAFEKNHGRTKFAASIARDIAALKNKLGSALAKPFYFNSTLRLKVYKIRRPWRGSEHEEIGKTPAANGKGVIIKPGMTWCVAPVDTRLTDAGLRRLAAEVQRQAIPGLNLEHCRLITDAGMAHLQRLTDLEFLNLWDTQITNRGLRAFRGMRRLKILNTGRTQVTDAGFVHLKKLTELEEAYLGHGRITDAGVAQLKGLTKLKALGLSKTLVTDRGLAQLRWFPALSTLQLVETRITDAGLVHLRNLTGLRILDLTGTRVTARGLAALKAARPDLAIRH